MISITYMAPNFTADEEVKKAAAVQQMQDLLENLTKAEKYRTLTVADRKSLLDKGFASDLVDNVVFFTERDVPFTNGKTEDTLVLGFTHAAFDPSLYACDSIRTALSRSHQGKCAYCESQLDHTGHGTVSHFRPAWGVMSDNKWQREAYYKLAYEPKNLLFSCESCHSYKSSQFPLYGGFDSDKDINEEQTLLINPYEDDPRAYIRFNPLTGEAYAYDEFSQFCLAYYQCTGEDVEKFLWQHPEKITEHIQIDSTTLKPKFSQAFIDWKSSKAAKQVLSKGQTTINVFGLNRQTLINARLRQAYFFSSVCDLQIDQQKIKDTEQKSTIEQLLKIQKDHPFYSLSIDTFYSYLHSKESLKSIIKMDTTQSDDFNHDGALHISPALASSLHYMVLENELSLTGKRRIVNLHQSDYLYGSDRSMKTIFLPINWEQDVNNVIKVFTGKNIWEASFSELSKTPPIALQNLFANNEIWAEGDYQALA